MLERYETFAFSRLKGDQYGRGPFGTLRKGAGLSSYGVFVYIACMGQWRLMMAFEASSCERIQPSKIIFRSTIQWRFCLFQRVAARTPLPCLPTVVGAANAKPSASNARSQLMLFFCSDRVYYVHSHDNLAVAYVTLGAMGRAANGPRSLLDSLPRS